MNSLLNKTLFYYSIFALILLLCSGPLFYWIEEKLYLDDVDEAIVLRKKEFYQNNMHSLKVDEIETWNRFNRDVRILSDTVTKPKERIFLQVFYDTLYKEWEPYRILYTGVVIGGMPYTLMIRLNLVESQDLIETTAILYLIILIVLFAGFLIISKLISNRLWKPFQHALGQIEYFNIEEGEVPVFSKTKTKEFIHLNRALEKLIAQNQKAYKTQKQFTQNAAHELQTPLAIFQSKLDLLHQDRSLTNPQADILQSLYLASSRLYRITKNLLLLAKIENAQFSDTSIFTINELITDIETWLEEQCYGKQLIIHEKIQSEISVSANRGLVEILLHNLLLNSIKHNNQAGNIDITILGDKLTIANPGIPEPLNKDFLFKRFSKGTLDAHSTGLGLAIVKEISSRYGWEVGYFFENDMHHFQINFQ